MRGLLVVNPGATTTSPRVLDVLVHALSHEVSLLVRRTSRRGDAIEMARQARRDGVDVVITLGGDGTVNEAINGMLADGPGPDVPMIAAVPGGSANVFARALGLPANPVEATGTILSALRMGRSRLIGLGRVDSPASSGSDGARWFAANAGLGIDADIIEAMERKRSAGLLATPTRYVTTTLTELFLRARRRPAALSLERDGLPTHTGVHLVIVQNTSPWTFLGSIPVNPCPSASFDSGLDLFAIERLDVATLSRVASRMLGRRHSGSARHGFTVWHDVDDVTVRAARPMRLQVDGEGLGEVPWARFEAVPEAIRAVA